MKRVKIILSAITVLAAVGGALAFKAKTFGVDYCYKTIAGGTGRCTASIQTSFDISNANTPALTYFYTTTTNLAACTTAGAPQCAKVGEVVLE
ncbi:hypothetical protein [Chitinophaga sp. GbtcB8]|uniref:hypothetical protein n=1 Tax=Chitinophaga sp. GbtcB8 TaxID=2824753 RepID=UPI001C2F7FEB|nr:hypothetical protein [Chitinophaga sp. GbtcB8]